MRRCLLTTLLLAFTLTGCARTSTMVVPPGTDRDQLAATIARRGQNTISDESIPNERPASQPNRLDRSVQWVLEATPVALLCVGLAPLVVLYALAPGPHAPLNLGSLGSSS